MFGTLPKRGPTHKLQGQRYLCRSSCVVFLKSRVTSPVAYVQVTQPGLTAGRVFRLPVA